MNNEDNDRMRPIGLMGNDGELTSTQTRVTRILREVAVDKQNITLALPKDVLKRVKALAAEQGTSVLTLMERLLGEHLARHEGYEQARR